MPAPSPDPFLVLLEVNGRAVTLGVPLLTDAGVRFVQALRQHAGPALPDWDPDRRQLRLRGRVLKEFRQPAPNQITVLSAFQAGGWARRIADPLPPFFGNDSSAAQQRLHETIKNLNRGLPPGTVRFRGDGSGRGVLWEPRPAGR